MNIRTKEIKDILKKNKLKFFLIFFAYIFLNGLINKGHITIPNFFSSYKLIFAIPFAILNFLIIPFLVSLTLILVIAKFKDLKLVSKKKGALPVLAIFATLLGGACPGCFVGLFPAFIGLFGATLTLANLPLGGLEIQMASAIILIISINYLTRPTICKIK